MTTNDTQPVGRSASKLLVRLPPALHQRIKDTAAAQGVSVNTLIAILLAGAVGFKTVDG